MAEAGLKPLNILIMKQELYHCGATPDQHDNELNF
jgi:hypothetical protein